MDRRRFVAGLAAAAAAPKLTIAAVEVWRLEGRRTDAGGVNRQHQVNPIHVYEARRPAPYRDSPTPTGRSVSASALYLKIKTGQGLEGLYGPIDREVAPVILSQLRGFLIGKDPLAGEALWDQMHRSNRHSRAGHFMMAISAVDNALWDLRGRCFNAPVYRLMGGPTRPAVEAYASCLGYSLEPEAMERRVRAFKDEGYRHQKWFLAYGPGDGPEGMRRNVEMVRLLREAAGEDVALMFDAYMGWDLAYALEWAKQVERYRPHWIEEAFHPDKIESFAALRRSIGFPVASGEHFYGRWEVQRYLAAGALHIVQADPEWCGGATELARICAVASAHDARVVPHGHGVHAALHVIASQSPMTCPLAEFLVLKMAHYHHFEKNPPRVERGRLALPERPGFGIELDPAKIEKQTQFSVA
ncbi:MAG: hypothetical protein IT529_22110 [Burkholderiales bacterium]|nr:hypothetical protein [Burkholderiales bacterium]